MKSMVFVKKKKIQNLCESVNTSGSKKSEYIIQFRKIINNYFSMWSLTMGPTVS